MIELDTAQYNLSWPLLNRIRWDGAKIKLLSYVMARKLHLSSSSFVTICLPFVLFCIKNQTLKLELEETYGDIIEKEIGTNTMSWRKIPMKFSRYMYCL